ncbi:non-canonical purine NTP diphosphatase [Flavobacterium sp. ASW18X]|uniref:non-canonical purine NTP diphosphatase n=1 Tax=Flavobacterium sp. ASW18X TaxID=2572595 RepID=UPI0010AE427F|nr:non-canonical purine NTP diphosphatase [Flavobacterium sp. ASW18X]TKD60717.1 non-canonical purine NTP diphosphatase [Flavobacterium sp. ASW18X]
MQLVFATHNLNKYTEIKALMPNHIELLTLDMIGCTEEIDETGLTLEANAQIKADYVTKTYNLPCFADDTGLLVDALDGAPGVYTARYAGPQKNANDNMNKLLAALENKDNRKAHFKTVIALNLNSKEKHQFNGEVHGTIALAQQGTEGFGYDPIFIPENYDQTFAQLPLQTKNTISHRARALEKLLAFLRTS